MMKSMICTTMIGAPCRFRCLRVISYNLRTLFLQDSTLFVIIMLLVRVGSLTLRPQPLEGTLNMRRKLYSWLRGHLTIDLADLALGATCSLGCPRSSLSLLLSRVRGLSSLALYDPS